MFCAHHLLPVALGLLMDEPLTWKKERDSPGRRSVNGPTEIGNLDQRCPKVIILKLFKNLPY